MNVLTTETSDTSTTHSNPSHADALKEKNPFISSIEIANSTKNARK